MSTPQEAKAKLEAALQEYVTTLYDETHWLGDWVLSATIMNMNGNADQVEYLHDGKGAFHSLRGLAAEQDDWLSDMKEDRITYTAEDED